MLIWEAMVAGKLSRGSEWRRWDPHVHAPGTLQNDGFLGDWDEYLARIESASPAVSALGITDYFTIRTYREVRRRKVEEGRLADVELLFPNVEMRLDIKTDRAVPINIHLLFSPEDEDHETEIARTLERLECKFDGRPYKCTEPDLIKIGRLLQPQQHDDIAALRLGALQFKVTLDDLRVLFDDDKWLRRNCLVAVAGGRNDGTSGMQSDDAYTLMRREIESFADIIFSSTPSQREFWLGKKNGLGREVIESTYRSLKPCIHGSDAHSVEKTLAPDLDRYTWIKGDATFEALRQAVIEPEERVVIGTAPPTHGATTPTVSRVAVADAPWLAFTEIELNPGLVAIIGERGSGKTALVEILARGANALPAHDLASASFLKRATEPNDLIGDASVRLTWSDGTSSEARVGPTDSEWNVEPPSVRYLSQQFVDQLCSSTGLATELRDEIERVIFDATPRAQRMNASTFSELSEVWIEPIRRRREELREVLREAGSAIEQEDQLKGSLAGLIKDKSDLEKKLEGARQDLKALLPVGTDERARRLLELERACTSAESRIELHQRRLQRIADLADEVEHVRSVVEPARHAGMKATFAGAGLTEDDWQSFAMRFVGDVDAVIVRNRSAVERAIAHETNGTPDTPFDPTSPLSSWPLNALLKERDKQREAVGIDVKNQRRYTELSAAIGKLESRFEKLGSDIRHAEGASQRRADALESRRSAYSQVFETFAKEETILTQLYAPLRAELGTHGGVVSKLEFKVERHVSLDKWVEAGEKLLDLRSATRFRGHGALKVEAERHLLGAWSQGAADDVAKAMDAFREEVQADLLQAMPQRVGAEGRTAWLHSVARWLYSTEHVTIRYSVTYDGVRVEKLSPGTRGIVLLLLFLAIDRQDTRPLIVDQPEENLDPKSVFDELVGHFRDARRRRQVIIVTHNANLVVNTDADQVLVATAKHEQNGRLPTISYSIGGLEDPVIRKAVCDTLEGGARAFLDRERRYRLRWGERLTAVR
jgi:energy-coupling factor transporter ATP-binding protein EcfA2